MTPRLGSTRDQLVLELGCQRWSEGLASYRPPAECIRPSEYDVVPMPTNLEARRFVTDHHYAGTFPPRRYVFGLYRRSSLVGVAVYGDPTRYETLHRFGVGKGAGVELKRFVLLDEVPGNGETWFLARTFALLRGPVRLVVSFSDPVPRSTIDGRIMHPGHVGTIYQAHNAIYTGRSKPGTVALLPDGTAIPRVSLTKVARGAAGAGGVVRRLVALGAEPLDLQAPREDRKAWLDRWLPRLTRSLVHSGNHRYVWALDRRLALPASSPYPKRRAA